MHALESFIASPWGALFIFSMSAINVTIMTFRTLMAVRGHSLLAAALGFCQTLIWVVGAGSALKHMDSPFHVLGYAAGFASGNYLGIWLEGRLAMGVSVVRAIFPKTSETSRQEGPGVAEVLRRRNLAVMEAPARGWQGEVDVVDVIVPRRMVPEVLQAVEVSDPDAFISVENVQTTRGVLPSGLQLAPKPREQHATWNARWRKAA